MIRSAAVTALVAAAGLVGAPSPALAAACSSDSGVTVVVDFHGLGGRGLVQDCVADQGHADDLFVAAGHTLENVNQQAFVCRVDGLPTPEEESCARTPPSDAYWGLWWSDGTSGTWSYSSQGAYSLDVPDGGAVAFSWNGSSSTSKPGVAPPKHEQSASPEPTKPASGGTKGSGGGSGGGTTSGGPTASTSTPSATPDASPSASGGRRDRDPKREDRGDDRNHAKKKQRDREVEPTGEPATSSSPETETAVVAEPSADTGGGLPVWVGPTAAAGALAVAGLAAYLRRRAA